MRIYCGCAGLSSSFCRSALMYVLRKARLRFAPLPQADQASFSWVIAGITLIIRTERRSNSLGDRCMSCPLRRNIRRSRSSSNFLCAQERCYWAAAGSTPQNDSHSGNEFAETERRDDAIVRASLKHAVGILGSAGVTSHDDTDTRRSGPESTASIRGSMVRYVLNPARTRLYGPCADEVDRFLRGSSPRPRESLLSSASPKSNGRRAGVAGDNQYGERFRETWVKEARHEPAVSFPILEVTPDFKPSEPRGRKRRVAVSA